LLVCSILLASEPAGAQDTDPPTETAAAPARAGADRAPSGARIWIHPGDRVRLVLRDSTVVEGEYEDRTQVSREDFEARYEFWRGSSPDGARMPAMGAKIEFVGGGIQTTGDGIFCGVSHDGVEIRTKKGRPIQTISFADFTGLLAPGRKRTDRRWIEKSVMAGEIPSLTALAVRGEHGLREIALDDVAWVETPARPTPFSPARGVFASTSSASRTSFAVQGGLFMVGDFSTRSLMGRVSTGVSGGPGGSFGIAVLSDQGVTAVLANAEFAPVVPVGDRIGIVPRVGLGLLAGGNVGLTTWNLGAGLTVRMTDTFGLRADWTRHWLLAMGNEEQVSTIFVGPFWMR
jgi:hypothetical protein